ncbi:hypothetical protein BJF78_04340 [Pseudonocardia sp. CNS-139]|nr:hypothetical protein BJF78_04340 [Pseudonocardia sp. CNS-139]
MGGPEPGELLALDRVEVGYPRGRERFTAVADVTLSVRRREFVAVVGPSGCGKTTLLKALGGLVPLTGGRITTGGGALPVSATVFQSPRLLRWRTVLDNVTFGLEATGHPRGRARATAAALLERVGLGEFADRYPRELSGGMQQRVNLARALAVDPQLLLLDEPFAALDAQTRESMQDYLGRVWFGAGTTALMVTHQVDEAVYLADRVVVLSARPARVVLQVEVPFARPRPCGSSGTPGSAPSRTRSGRRWNTRCRRPERRAEVVAPLRVAPPARAGDPDADPDAATAVRRGTRRARAGAAWLPLCSVLAGLGSGSSSARSSSSTRCSCPPSATRSRGWAAIWCPVACRPTWPPAPFRSRSGSRWRSSRGA